MVGAQGFFHSVYQNTVSFAGRYAVVNIFVSYSKVTDLEEELKNVTNNLKSLEAQAEKVRYLICPL